MLMYGRVKQKLSLVLSETQMSSSATALCFSFLFHVFPSLQTLSFTLSAMHH